MSNDTGFLPYDPKEINSAMSGQHLRDLLDQVEQDTEAWMPEPGDKVGGTLVDVDEASSDFGDYPLITIKTPNGSLVNVHAFHTVLRNTLNKKLAKGMLKVGDQIAIMYKGEGEARDGKNAPNMYRVAIKQA